MTDATPRTMFAKIWDAHVVTRHESGQELLYIDRHFAHEGSFHAFKKLAAMERPVLRPGQTFGIADHYVPTGPRPAVIGDAQIGSMIELLTRHCATHGIELLGLDDPRQGIVHVVGPELGITLPGLTIVCGDSHTSTHGALGALAFGIGASEVAQVLATQSLWQKRPRTMRVRIDGRLGPGVTAKDVILAVIGTIGARGGSGHVIEYAGEAVRALSIAGRLTLCNMSIEAGARAGTIAPDETTIAYLDGRPWAPKGDAFARATEAWLALRSDADASFDRDVELDGSRVEPQVTWGTSPEQTLPIGERVPDPVSFTDPGKRAAAERALHYMGLRPGTALETVAVDRVFIGSCTNARLEDLEAAARVLDGRKVQVPTVVVPGSTGVKAEAERRGVDRVFKAAGADWRESGCSMCVGINGEVVAAGERCASTTNRNFEGRQGKGARTHLLSPPMAAAAAVTGHLTDVRKLLS